MKKKLLPVGISGGLFLIILGYSWLTDSFSFVALSNRLFLTSLPFLIIGSLLFVFSSGFFDRFQQSMHQAFRRKKKEKTDYRTFSSIGHQRFVPWLIIAGVLIVLSILFALL